MLKVEAVIDEDNGRLSVVDVMDVFRVCEESNGTRHPFLYLGEGVYGGVLIALHSALDKLGNLLCRKFHIIFKLNYFCKNNDIFPNGLSKAEIFAFFEVFMP